MRDLVDTTEMYLRTIYELEEEGITPLRARIVERLEQSGPTVSQTVARMERDELLKVLPDRSLQLTEEGRQRATSVMRKHRLAERLLTDVLKLDIHKVHDEACRWEHVMSDEVERRVLAVLDHPTHSPFGNPIPGIEELGVDAEPAPEAEGIRPIDLPSGETKRARVLQLNEILQMDNRQFRAFHDAGIRPGTEVEIYNEDGLITIIRGDKTIELNEGLGHALRVEVLD
ncbi:diptheria toxin repressor [Corynebacterium renale]|uniref:Diphtheria toxin repressor n=1 Tax=Corynebacterium renale TaxID=1724 RepID=A0A2A9DPQ4_9CORY|nr:metal-dependent transcriptional regulator [Corynebacterium renale]PFG28574.1 DtxR family iron (metal) dependent repressor [Corynebacterium renale]SQG64833.1 diptheria toxin repressor [Corynebacterium renale]SQI26206.1 diptheria toxin repressor [Corynebacterium renale]STC96393.1 diptheria toxin repressor [Corynebacterium renale]